jgi:hypothetical protein
MGPLIAKREFLARGLGLGLSLGVAGGSALAQDDLGRTGESAPAALPPLRKARTTKLFLSPPGWPNAITADPERGFWVQEQRHDNKQEAAWLLDPNGKLLKTVMTNCKDTSGMAYGDGCIWSGANGASEKVHPKIPVDGIFQTDMNGKQVSVRQIPFGPAADGGSCHGMSWQNGKLWLYANRIEQLMRIDPKSWQVDYMFSTTTLRGRLHGIECDGDHIWQVCGAQDPKVQGYEGYTPGLVKYDIATGKVVQMVDFVPGSCDIHDVAVRGGILYGVDAGEHPGWPLKPAYQRPGFPPLNSPSAGYIFRIDLI